MTLSGVIFTKRGMLPFYPAVTARFYRSCYKWEQGEIPSAHARSLGLRTEATIAPGDGEYHGDRQESWGSLRNAQWTKDGRFITYWSEKVSGRPVKWIFFDGAEFEVRSGRR